MKPTIFVFPVVAAVLLAAAGANAASATLGIGSSDLGAPLPNEANPGATGGSAPVFAAHPERRPRRRTGLRATGANLWDHDWYCRKLHLQSERFGLIHVRHIHVRYVRRWVISA